MSKSSHLRRTVRRFTERAASYLKHWGPRTERIWPERTARYTAKANHMLAVADACRTELARLALVNRP